MAAKRVRRCKQEGNISKDRISELPDDVLISIVSRLSTMKEAARTSVLSHRWEKLWTSCVSRLNFDASDVVEYIRCHSGSGLETGRLYYLRWVNQILESLHSNTTTPIEEFRICFDLKAASAPDINSWISFAFKKKVESLELDLSTACGDPFGLWYIIPREHFGLSSSSSNSLKVLRMTEVDVSDEVFEHILSTSPCLEHLYVKKSYSLVNVRISSPSSLNLKYFEIYACLQLQSIEISGIPLVSFKHCGHKKIDLVLNNLPQLVEVSFGQGDGYPASDKSRQLSTYLSQINKLALSLNRECSLSPTYPEEVAKWPTLSNLRHLELVVFANGGMLIDPVISLLEASPFLHTFKLKFIWTYYYCWRSWPERMTPKITKKHPYQFLKVVELLGFVGDTEDAEIAMYLLENAKSLSKLIVSLADLEFLGIELEILEVEKHMTTERALELGKRLPLGAEFLMYQNTKSL